MTFEAIKSAIPHREPFLLVDEIVEQIGQSHRLPQAVHGRRVLVSRAITRSFR